MSLILTRSAAQQQHRVWVRGGGPTNYVITPNFFLKLSKYNFLFESQCFKYSFTKLQIIPDGEGYK